MAETVDWTTVLAAASFLSTAVSCSLGPSGWLRDQHYPCLWDSGPSVTWVGSLVQVLRGLSLTFLVSAMG